MTPPIQNQKLIKIEVSNLYFDPNNPRLPRSLQGTGKEQDVLQYMIEDGNVVDLIDSIGSSGFFAGEPLLVVESSNKGKYEVVEGNRRLAALMLLQNPTMAPKRTLDIRDRVDNATYRPKEVDCIIYNERKDILDFLGYRHISGIKEWDALMKARYLKQLWDQVQLANPGYKESQMRKALAKKIGSKSDYVERILFAYDRYREAEDANFYGIVDLDESSFKFSLLSTAFSYKNIDTYVRDPNSVSEENPIDAGHLKDLFTWIYARNSNDETIVKESRNLKMLNAVVAVPAAVERLKETGDLMGALDFTLANEELLSQSFKNAINGLQTANSLIHKLKDREVVKEALNLSREVFELSKDIKNRLQSRVDDED